MTADSNAPLDPPPPSDEALTQILPGSIRGTQLRRTMSLVTIAWMFGSVWVTATAGAPLALFAEKLHASEWQFGLLTALPYLASFLSLPASILIERTGLRGRIFLWGLYLNRILWFPLALLPLLIITRYGFGQAAPAMALFIALYMLMNCGQAVGGPAWTSWMADIVPSRVNGVYFSRRRQWGLLTAIPTALIVGALLDRAWVVESPMATLRWCAIIFCAAAAFGMVDIHMFHYVPEPHKPPQRGKLLFKALLEPLRHKQFLVFGGFVGTLTFAVSFIGQFVTLFIVEKMRINSMQTQLMLLVAPSVVQLLMLPLWGLAADRMGKKPVLLIAALGLVPVGLGWCLMGVKGISPLWLGYILSAAGTGLWTGVEVANLNLVLEMAGSAEGVSGGSSYVAVNSVIINLAGCMGGLAAGEIAQTMRHWAWIIPGFKTLSFYDILFALSAVMRLAAVALFLPFLSEPQARPTHQTLRFMTANIYNNMSNAILLPLRWMKVQLRNDNS